MPDRSSTTSELEEAVEEFYKDFPYPPTPSFVSRFVLDFELHCAKKFGKAPAPLLSDAIIDAVCPLYEYEAPKATFEREVHSDPVDHARYRDKLLALLTFKDKPHAYRLSCFAELLTAVFEPLIAALPAEICITATNEPPEQPTVPLIAVLSDPKLLIEMMLAPFAKAHEQEEFWHDGIMGTRFSALMAENLKARKPPITGTPFIELFEAPVPAVPKEEPGEPAIEERSWYRHALLLAQPGAGKTNAIRWRIAQLIPQIREGKASLILLEPKGVLTKEMLTLARAQGLENRVVFIDPIYAPVSVNIFDRGDGSTESFNVAIGHISRVLGTITLALTDIQLSTMAFALRALFSLPEEPTLERLIQIFRKGKEVLPLDKLSDATRDFFEFDYQPDRNIVSRLGTMRGNPIYETLFDTRQPNFDIGEEMQKGKLIVINAGLSDIVYGRFWIEEVSRTIRSRLALLDEDRRVPTTFIIDEAQEFIAEDLHFARILDTAREAKIGLLIAAHHMDQINNAHVRGSLYNCVLKFVAHTNADIHNLSRSMGKTETDFLTTVPLYQFAFHGPNMEQAARVKLPPVEFARARQEDITFFRTRAPQPTSPSVEQVAALSPLAAILETRRKFEDAVRATVIASSLPNFTRGTTIFDMIQALQAQHIVDEDTAKFLHRLRKFGNDAAHNYERGDLTKEAAVKFQEWVDEVVGLLQSETLQKLKGRDEGDFDTNWQEPR